MSILDRGQLQQRVQGELDADAQARAGNITVEVEDGTVTLTGVVPSLVTKTAAEQAVLRVRGVRTVANVLDIRRPADEGDPRVAHDVELALIAEPGVPDSVQATVDQAVVTLQGTVESFSEKAAADWAVRHLPSVHGVRNLLVVRPASSLGRRNAPVDGAAIPNRRGHRGRTRSGQ